MKIQPKEELLQLFIDGHLDRETNRTLKPAWHVLVQALVRFLVGPRGNRFSLSSSALLGK